MKYLKYLAFFSIIFLAVACSKDDDEPKNEGGNNKPDIEKPDNVGVKLPKKELRGVWMATVWGLDWPMSRYDEPSQKRLYTQYLDLLQECNMNAIFFQVRGMADAFYESKYEPWCKQITGNANVKPNYDVLNFLIEEAHKRGIQFHAWINPYRIATRGGNNQGFPALDKRIPKEWTKDYNRIRVYNPALPEVQQRIVDIVKEIITKYDVDGIHMDDYFYPEIDSSESMNDKEEYAKYGSQFKTVEEFRRNNVNLTIKNIQKAIIDTKPDVIFSVSPAADIQHNYKNLYADTKTWSENGWVDVMIPQLYTATGDQDYSFNIRLGQWSHNTYKNKLMIGYGIYKFGDPNSGSAYQTADDIAREFNYANKNAKVEGSVLYSAKSLQENKVGVRDAIKKQYRYLTLLPYMGRGEAAAPGKPGNVQCVNRKLSWSAVPGAVQYGVYRSNGKNAVAELVGITTETSFSLKRAGAYFVTAVSKNNAESAISDMAEY